MVTPLLAPPVTLQLQLTPTFIEQLRDVLRPTQADLEVIAELVSNRLQQEPDSYSVAEFAKRIKKSASHIHREIKRGKLRAVRPGGGDRRITRADAALYLNGIAA